MAEEGSWNPKEVYGPVLGNKWVQLVLGVVGMVMIAGLQYAWTLFVPPLREAFGWSLTATQLGFTLFIVCQTYAQPVQGYLLDRFGPRILYSIAAVMVGVGWSALGMVTSLKALYFFYGMAGLGAGLVYSCSIAVAVTWFQNKRGLASGIIAAGFGLGAAPFIPAIGSIMKHYGYGTTFLCCGIVQGLVLLMVAQFIKYTPSKKITQKVQVAATEKKGLSPWEMIRTPHFWLIYLMFICINTGGIACTAQVKPFAKDIGIAANFVILVVTVNQIGNGIGRIILGWVSDKIGRERTMFIDFTLNGILMLLLPVLGRDPIMFMVLLFLIFFTWGPQYALFPAKTTDTFGTTYAATNNGIVYSAKGIGGILGGVVSAYLATTVGWTNLFYILAILSFISGAGALVSKRIGKPVLNRTEVSAAGI